MTIHRPKSSLKTLEYDNRFVRCLKADPEPRNFRRQVAGSCFSRVLPTPVNAPELVAFSRETAQLVGLSEKDCQSPTFAQVFTGNQLLPGMDPFAMCYGGHQFGNWAGQLGDGRAINLGEVLSSTTGRWILQLKGAGPTPYSRNADGLAVLRSSIREFLCSEAMHHLGVPTTRALSLTLTGEPVERDMFYDGHPKEEPGAVVCRVSPSFIRFGNFQIHAARGETQLLRQLMDYTIETDFPHLDPKAQGIYFAWFKEVCTRTMEMVIHWMRVGFVHGVMNTDNMSIMGLTIDYGPYGWLEDYSPTWTPNTTDAQGRRYSYANQPGIALWNLAQLANAILPVTGKTETLQEILDETVRCFTRGFQEMMARKLGFFTYDPELDPGIITATLDLLGRAETDYTLFFRGLGSYCSNAGTQINPDPLPTFLNQALYQPQNANPEYKEQVNAWLTLYEKRLEMEGLDPVERKKQMDRVNPKYVLRNYLAQQAIEKAEAGDYSRIWELLDIMRRPYDSQAGKEKFAQKRPEWARHKPGCSMLSCSS